MISNSFSAGTGYFLYLQGLRLQELETKKGTSFSELRKNYFGF
jgi:hypothetical protein